MAVFELGDDTLFTYRGSWCAAGLGTSWECAWRFVGSRGSLLWDGREQLLAEVVMPGRSGLFDEVAAAPLPCAPVSARVGGHLGVLQDFIAAVRDGPVPETIGRDNIHSLAMTLGAIDSAKSGRRVDIVI